VQINEGRKKMKSFFKEMLERAIKTAAQAAIASLAPYLTVSEVDWRHCLGIVGIATLLSILTSLSSFKFGEKGTACAIKINKEEQQSWTKPEKK